MGLIFGIVIVAGFLYFANNRNMDWRGGLMNNNHWHEGPPPLLIIVGFGILLLLMMHMLPLLIIGAGGYFAYRVLSHNKGSMPVINLGTRGPGRVADAAEAGIFCPSCNTAVSRNWATCPHCGYRKYLAPELIRRRCSTCGTELQKDWNACPYCSTTIQEPITASAPGPAQPQGPTSTALL
ncbi:MAG: zinc ribbon domain-containing protein [Chloroflexota bacterium]